MEKEIFDMLLSLRFGGLISSEVKINQEDNNKKYVLLQFKTAKNAIVEKTGGNIDKDSTIELKINIKDDGIMFIMTDIAQCNPYDQMLTLFMDANNRGHYGTIFWSSKTGSVHCVFVLPMNKYILKYLDSEMLSNIVSSIYNKRLFIEYMPFISTIKSDPLIDEKKKDEKIAMIENVASELQTKTAQKNTTTSKTRKKETI